MNRKELSCARLSQIVVVGIQLITSTTNFINLYCYGRLGPSFNSLHISSLRASIYLLEHARTVLQGSNVCLHLSDLFP